MHPIQEAGRHAEIANGRPTHLQLVRAPARLFSPDLDVPHRKSVIYSLAAATFTGLSSSGPVPNRRRIPSRTCPCSV